jgi:hypothetical protein
MYAACLRLLVVDLAVRICAIMWLTRQSDAAPLPICWAEPRGIPKFVKGLLETAHPKITRQALSEIVGVHPHTVDGWLDDGVRPTDANLEEVARALAEHGVGPANGLIRRLRLLYGAQTLFHRLVDVFGIDCAAELADRLVAWANVMLEFPRRSRNPRENDLKMAMALMFGCLGRVNDEPLPWVTHMLAPALRGERVPAWRTSIRHSTGRWLEHLQGVAGKLGPSVNQELRQVFGADPPHDVRDGLFEFMLADPEDLPPMFELGEAVVIGGGGPPAGVALKIQAMAAAARGDSIGAIDLMREAVSCDPADAENHFRFGCFLWQIGDTDAGLAELEIAVQLAPHWDRPRVEIGIVLLNLERHAEARARLEAFREQLPEVSTWLLFHLGVACERCGDSVAAMAAYEAHLAAEPEHAEVLDRLAHLLLISGDKRRGAELAKRAAHLGVPTVHDAREQGYYRKGDVKVRPPHTIADEFVQCTEKPWANRRR